MKESMMKIRTTLTQIDTLKEAMAEILIPLHLIMQEETSRKYMQFGQRRSKMGLSRNQQSGYAKRETV